MKFKTKRFLSGLLAFVTIATSAIQPVPALAAEGGAEKPPSYETVKEFLDADEVVTARNLVCPFLKFCFRQENRGLL